MVKIVVENGLGNCLKLSVQNWLWKLKLYKGYINVLLYEKVQLNVYKILFDNEYIIYIHDISSYSCIFFSDT